MHFLVAFAPKIHVQLEFLLVSKIDLASASRAVCAVDLVSFCEVEIWVLWSCWIQACRVMMKGDLSDRGGRLARGETREE